MLLKADQLPLRKGLITAEAALRKAQNSQDIEAPGTLWWLNEELIEAKSKNFKENKSIVIQNDVICEKKKKMMN